MTSQPDNTDQPHGTAAPDSDQWAAFCRELRSLRAIHYDRANDLVGEGKDAERAFGRVDQLDDVLRYIEQVTALDGLKPPASQGPKAPAGTQPGPGRHSRSPGPARKPAIPGAPADGNAVPLPPEDGSPLARNLMGADATSTAPDTDRVEALEDRITAALTMFRNPQS